MLELSFNSLQTKINNKQDALLFTPENTANKGVPYGYAGLGSDGKVLSSQLPTSGGGVTMSQVLNRGINTVATGSYANAEGNSVSATGYVAHAEGYGTQAIGDYSHAEGMYTVANDTATHVEGRESVADGGYAHAEGYITRALTAYTHSEGVYTIAGQGKSLIISAFDDTNKTLTLNDVSSIVVGDYLYIMQIGNMPPLKLLVSSIDTTNKIVTFNTTSSLSSNCKYAVRLQSKGTYPKYATHAEGQFTIASGGASHSEGLYTVANGDNSHAEGYNTLANGYYSHSEGRDTVASGDGSHTEGYATVASGFSAHAEGSNNTASASYSHVEGYNNNVSNIYSHVEGTGNICNMEGSHIMGQYGTTTDNYSWHLGNGTSATSRGLAIKITSTGKVFSDSTFSSAGADYAEMFEWADNNPNEEDRVGLFVTFDEIETDKIRIANEQDDYILGIVSANPTVIGDNAALHWNGRFLLDEWGRKQFHEVVIPDVKQTVYYDNQYEQKYIPAILDDEGNIIEEEKVEQILIKEAYQDEVIVIPEHIEIQPIINPEWKPEQEYIPRNERREWDAIGMMGKLLVQDDGTCIAGSYCKSNNYGIATKSDSGYRVLKRTLENQIMVLVR